MTMRAFGFALAGAACLALPASAHHSHGNYDLSQWTLMEGTVRQVVLVTPHSIIYLDVKDTQGQATTWSLEATSARGVMENGVKREDVRTGDSIKVRCHRLRDGSSGCLLGFVTPNHGDQARGHGVEKEWD